MPKCAPRLIRDLDWLNLPRDTRLSRPEAAKALTANGLPTATATLTTVASRGDGPPFRKFNNYVVYEWGEILDWAISRCKPVQRSATAHRAMANKVTAAPPNRVATKPSLSRPNRLRS